MPSQFQFQSGAGGGSSSSGSAGKNYASTYFDGTIITGINTYNDGASATPTDGTGGTATGLSTTLNSSTPLRGTKNQRFSKDNSNRQGCGWSIDFAADPADYEGSKACIVTFRYRVSSGYANNDMRVFAYNKDTSTLINVLSLTGDGSVGYAEDATLYTASFNFADADNDYRLIFHVAGTTAAAWDFDIIDWTITPSQSVPGAIVASLGTETWTDNQANAATSVVISRAGNRVKVLGLTSFTGAMSGVFSVTIPAAYTPLASLYPVATAPCYVGGAIMEDTGTNAYNASVLLTGINTLTFYAHKTDATYETPASTTSLIPFTWANTDIVHWNAEWIVDGWLSTAALSTTQTMLQTVVACASGNPASATSGNPFIVPNVVVDTHSAYNASTGRFTCPSAGNYRVSIMGVQAATSASWFIYKNASIGLTIASTNGVSTVSAAGTGIVVCAQGDILDVRPNATVDLTACYICFERIPDFTIFSVYGQTEYQESKVTNSTANWPHTAATFGDFTSLTLQPGEWDLTGMVEISNSGAVTAGIVVIGISTTSGNSGTGSDTGDTRASIYNPGTSGAFYTLSIPNVRVVLTTPTTYYLKGYNASSITNLKREGYRLSARRVK